MSFKTLLKAKDEAVIAYEQADAALSEALQVREMAEADLAAATQALEAAHCAIRDVLKEKGHHSTVAADGTITVFHAVDEEKSPQGWASYQPIPGEDE